MDRSPDPRPVAVAVALLIVGIALTAARPALAARSPSPFRHSLARIDARLRLAIETRPAQLGEYARSSELVCELAREAEDRGDAAAAEADWSTLSQLYRERDLPASDAVDAALKRADASLLALRTGFSRGWRRQPAKVRELKRGVAVGRRGIGILRRTMRRIAAAFGAWERRECEAAQSGIELAARRLAVGVDRVNRGMWRLWRLALG